MRRQTGHLDTDVLAEFRAGLITGRRRRAIAAHLTGCARCSAADTQLAELSALLAAIPAPVMPDSVAQRLDAALAAEVAHHQEAERAVAHHSRNRRRPPRPARRPTLQLVMTRVLVQVAALVVIALAVTALLTHVAGVNAWWLLPLAAFAALAWSLRRATSGKS